MKISATDTAVIALSFVCGAVTANVVMALLKKRADKKEVTEPEVTAVEPEETMVISHSEEPFVEEPETEPISGGVVIPEVIKPMPTEEFAKIIKNYGGTSNKTDTIGPYVISEEDLDEYEDYDNVYLVYYADDILADENGVKVDDIDDKVGEKFSQYFGAFGQPDMVCIRNDERRCDYTITKSLKKWSTVDSENPHMKWR